MGEVYRSCGAAARIAVDVPTWRFTAYAGHFPTYGIAVFIVPLAYGCWRFVLFHLLAGPVLAFQLTDNANEIPAIWCLFSIGIILIGLSPWLRGRFRVPPGRLAAQAG